MTAVRDYEELHHLVDRLTPDQARALRSVALHLVEGHDSPSTKTTPTSEPVRRRLSFAGLMDAEPNLAARSEDILREEFGQPRG